MQGSWVQSLVIELRSHMPSDKARGKKSPLKQHLIRIIKLNQNRAVSDTISEGDKM